MINRIYHAIASAARELIRRWGALLIMLALYLAMIGAIYLFFVTREANIGQLLLSFLLAISAPALFFVIQTMAARYRSEGGTLLGLLGRSLRDFWKLFVIALPLIFVALLAAYLFAKVEPSAPAATIREAVRAVPASPRPAAPKPQPIHWQTVVITTLEYLLFCLVLPLGAIHLWIETAQRGLAQAFKESPRVLARGFAPKAVVTYAIGFIFFVVVPYFLIVTRTPVTSAWVDAGLLVARLVLAAAFSLFGWVATVGALGELMKEGSRERAAQTGEQHVPAEA